MRILITGAAGYIGSKLAAECLIHGDSVIGVDNFFYGNQDALLTHYGYTNFSFHNVDVRDTKAMQPLLSRVDVIVHLAALVGANICKKHPTIALGVNQLATEALVGELSKNQTIIYANTNSGYGVGGEEFCTEESELKPLSLYGRSKCEGETAVLRHPNSYSLRLATVFGLSYRPRFDLMLNNFVAQMFYDREIKVFEPYFRRNLVHVNDVVASIRWLARGKPTGVYNVGHPRANITKGDLIIEIGKHLGTDIKITTMEGNDPDARDYYVSNKKLIDTGFSFKNPLSKGIIEVADYLATVNKDKVMKMGNFQ